MISPTTQVLDRLVRGYVAAGSGLDSRVVIPQDRKGPAPRGVLYATVLNALDESDGLGWSRPATVRDSGADAQSEDEFESSTITYSVQWYRDGAHDAARRFRLWARSPLGRMECERRGLTLISLGDIRSIDQIISEEWEERRQMEFQIGIVSVLRERPGTVETVSVQLCADGVEQQDIPLDAND